MSEMTSETDEVSNQRRRALCGCGTHLVEVGDVGGVVLRVVELPAWRAKVSASCPPSFSSSCGPFSTGKRAVRKERVYVHYGGTNGGLEGIVREGELREDGGDLVEAVRHPDGCCAKHLRSRGLSPPVWECHKNQSVDARVGVICSSAT